MSAAAIPLAIGGGVLSLIGQNEADKAQIEAERANADFLEEQARFAALTARREEEAFSLQAEQVLSEQRSAFARAGISLAGSPLLIQELTIQERDRQIADIREEGRQNVRLAMLRAQRSSDIADSIRSSRTLRQFGTILGVGSNVATISAMQNRPMSTQRTNPPPQQSSGRGRSK